MHRWGDEKVDWGGIEDAATWIGDQLQKWGRIYVSDTKEKWGTVRVYCGLSNWMQERIYRWVYARALRKWPHLVGEILVGADYHELLLELDPRFSVIDGRVTWDPRVEGGSK